MYQPIFVLAGQSNATTIAGSVHDALAAQYGPGGYQLVEAYANGAPLTYTKVGDDWATQGELPDMLANGTINALNSNPDAVVEGVIWVQGEGDAYHFANVGSYSDRFADLFQSFEDTVDAAMGARHSGIADANVVVSTLSDNASPSATQTQWDEVRQEHFQIAAQDGDVTVVNPDTVASANGVPTGDMFRDALHYSSPFSDVLAEELVRVAGLGVLTPAGKSVATGPSILPARAGDDVFVVGDAFDQIVDPTGLGHDSVSSSVSFSLRSHNQFLEDLTLSGSGDLSGTGNGLGNVITGNAGNNVLDGAWGNDTLIGGAGDDTLIGGRGDDTFLVDGSGDRVTEVWNGGHDQVQSSVSFSLRSHNQFLEDLTLAGGGDMSGTGNSQGNVITGNAGDNVLDGAWGNDTLIGGAGDDTLIGGHHGDHFLVGGGSGHDRVEDFEAGLDRIHIEGYDFAGSGGDPARADFMSQNAQIVDETDMHIDLGGGDTVYLRNVITEEMFGEDPGVFGDFLF
ncbi:MAG: hypothetical protein GY717_06075, partial [Rhodobacteraceae bacterium]|nr:hypothetical protein [Paracoccaceae bacterium]